MELIPLDRDYLNAFGAYLLPEARDALRTGQTQWLVTGAVAGSCSCGAAAARQDGDKAEVRSLFVDETIRGQGVGTALLEDLCRRLRQRGAMTVRLSYVVEEQQREAMERLLRHCGFSAPQRGAPVFRVHSADVHQLRHVGRAFSTAYHTPPDVVGWEQLTDTMRQTLAQDKVIPSYLSWTALQGKMDPLLSVASVNQDKVEAYLLAGQSDDGGYVLLSAMALPGAGAMALFRLLPELLHRCYFHGGGDFLLHFSTMTPRMTRLAQRLMGQRYETFYEYSSQKNLDPYKQEEIK